MSGRFWIIGGIAAAVVVTIAAVSAYAFTGGSTKSATRPPRPHPVPPRPAPCALRVADSAIVRNDYTNTHITDSKYDLFLVSAIIENPCPRVAVNASFTIYPLDSHGAELAPVPQFGPAHLTVDLVLPGARAATFYRMPRQELPDGVAGVSVRQNPDPDGPPGPPCWMSADAAGFRTTARATDIVLGPRESPLDPANGQADLSFTVTWGATERLVGARAALVIFRDSHGRLLDAGGSGQSIGTDLKRGQREQFTVWVPPHADPAHTEVILQPDPNTHGLPYSPPPQCLPS